MKRLLLAFLISISIQHSFAQANGSKTFSIFISPDFSYRSLSGRDSISKSISTIKNLYENPIYTYTGGITVSRKLFSIFAIETGINYSKKGFSFDSSSLSGNYNFSSTYIYNFLQIPFKLKAYIPINKWNFYINAGVSGMMLVDAISNSIVTKNGNPTLSTEKLKSDVTKRFNYNLVFGVGLDYRITKRFYLKVEPTFTKTLESIRKDKLDTYLYSGGVNLGFLYVVKK